MIQSAVPFEREAKVSASPGHHIQMVPVFLKESERPGADPICRDNLEASILIQGIICPLEVQEYLKEALLPHGRKLL